MGAGVNIPRTLNRALGAAFAGACATGCIDFVEPNIPGISDRGSAALFEARIVVTDSGRVNTDARLTPGLDFEGFRRPVTAPQLEVIGRVLEPDSVRPDGTLRYIASWDVGPNTLLAPITLRAPEVEGVVAPLAIEWFGLRRAGPDSIRLLEGEDLLLPVAAVDGTSRPEPSIRQWFLTLSSGGHSLRLSADGVPPDPISVPPRWIPQGDTVHVRLIFTQSAILEESPGDYLGVVTADTWLSWSVLVDRKELSALFQGRFHP